MSLQQLNSESFEDKVYEEGQACLIVFSRKSCHVCKEVIPMVEELQPKYEGKLSFYYIDAEEDKTLYKSFSLKGVPQILFFNSGEYQGKLTGKVDEEEIEEKIEESLLDL